MNQPLYYVGVDVGGQSIKGGVVDDAGFAWEALGLPRPVRLHTLYEIPAVFVLGFWFVQQVLFGAYNLTNPTGGGGGVAYFAHIGGFVFGLLAIKAFAQRVKQAPSARFPVY